ncbi:MAG: LysM peptidoglycan-binding domain-containing protein [Phycisphaerae bacterium]|nr:LysM peptidoglycan-binding domain-containing protein [Phycisphaerae bacterium]
MTADAKVGLLLGLVFIVIIAFLVNGLPNVFHGSEAEGAVETSVALLPRPNIVLEGPVNEVSLPRAASVPSRQVPAPTEVLVVDLPPEIVQTAMAHAAAVSATIPSAVVPERRLVRHQVKSGEYLTTIASLVYGPETGKTKSAIEAIARANGLKAPYTLQIGQVLAIPDLNPQSVDAPAITADVPVKSVEQANTWMDRVKDVFSKQKDVDETPQVPVSQAQASQAQASQVQAPKVEVPKVNAAPDTIQYVVKKGDSLSQISSKHLGTVKRVDEILKLNREHIRNADDIVEGTVLKLPKR